MELSEIGRLEGGIEDGRARRSAQGLAGCGIYVVESERVRPLKWFADAET